MDSRLYELRYYQLAAQDAVKFKALACANVPARAKRSRLVGFWATEIGAVNHVLHMWEYDSLSHRKAVRDEMATHADWTGFLSQASPMFQRMDNWLCRSLLGNITAVWSDKEFYKITTVRYMPGALQSQSAARGKFLASVGGVRMPGSGTNVKAALETVIGNSREFILLESTTDLQALLPPTDGVGPFDDEVSATVETKILCPYPWSEWLEGSS